MEKLVGAVPRTLAPAIAKRCYYFVPLVIVEGDGKDGVVAAPHYTVDLGDRAICHRNVSIGAVEAVFFRPAWSKTALDWPSSSSSTWPTTSSTPPVFPRASPPSPWSQAQAGVKGETSQDAWETRRRALDPVTNAEGTAMPLDERARKNYEESAFSDSLAIYMLSAVS